MIILTIIMVEVLSKKKNDKKLTKIDEIYQDSENPVIHNGPKSTKIAPVSQN